MHLLSAPTAFALLFCLIAKVTAQGDDPLLPCGDAFYHASEYTCYPSNFLCPVLNGTPSLKCGGDCYLPNLYGCVNDHLVQASTPGPSPTSSNPVPGNNPSACSSTPTTQYLTDPPYINYFYSDCNIQAQAVVTSPLADSNLTMIGPRLIIAWPAGNSGVCAFFAPQNGINGSLGIELVNSTAGQALSPVYVPANGPSEYPRVGVSGTIRFNSSAMLTVPILGSIRTIRDFTEGPSLLVPMIQSAIRINSTTDGGVTMSRLWLDNVTVTEFAFIPQTSSGASAVMIGNQTLNFTAGDYTFYADFNYPQLTQLNASTVLNPSSQDLITQDSDQVKSLQFLSYTEKLLAGAWRFLTYFGRDSMIASLLLQPVLSDQAIEAVIGAVLERINSTDNDGSVCHEETIGDYATYLNEMMNITSTAPSYSYIMIDSDYYLPILMDRYFLTPGTNNTSRASALLSTTAGTINPANANLTYSHLAQLTAEKLMNIAAQYASPGNQTSANLAHLKSDQIVGQWRDSTYGIGGGRIPYDVNTALMPAALHSISSLAAAGIYPNHTTDWPTLAASYAQIWEDTTLSFFEITVPQSEAQSRLQTYVNRSSFPGPDQSTQIDNDVTFHALSLDGYDNLTQVAVMNTDDCFRLFLLNTTNQTQLTSFVNQTANNIRRTFPAGLLTDVGMLIANPAFGEEAVYAANWTTGAYHGTVVWSWPLAMMARGLEIQLSRCNNNNTTTNTSLDMTPDFCTDSVVYGNVKGAYNALWDVIEANSAELSTEVWSWGFEGGEFVVQELATEVPPEGTTETESDIRQLWSLTFLAVMRDEGLR